MNHTEMMRAYDAINWALGVLARQGIKGDDEVYGLAFTLTDIEHIARPLRDCPVMSEIDAAVKSWPELEQFLKEKGADDE